MDRTEDLRQALIAVERAGWEALAAGRGVAFYQDVLLDEGLMVFPVGAFGKAEALQGIAGAPPWDRYELRDLRVIALGREAASVVYRVEAERAGYPVYRAIMSSTYVRQQGAWKLVLHTQTPTAS
jgi:Domain of unknown function (DUF4440)